MNYFAALWHTLVRSHIPMPRNNQSDLDEVRKRQAEADARLTLLSAKAQTTTARKEKDAGNG